MCAVLNRLIWRKYVGLKYKMCGFERRPFFENCGYERRSGKNIVSFQIQKIPLNLNTSLDLHVLIPLTTLTCDL